jgi:uncharacterized protein with PIN domain
LLIKIARSLEVKGCLENSIKEVTALFIKLDISIEKINTSSLKPNFSRCSGCNAPKKPTS